MTTTTRDLHWAAQPVSLFTSRLPLPCLDNLSFSNAAYFICALSVMRSSTLELPCLLPGRRRVGPEWASRRGIAPSLPTYAAALAQSGLGTGDVEDNLIAIPPPPAYGNTRGSTLLLRGFLRNSLREAVTSRDSQHRMSVFSQRSSRPVSYHSQDGDAAERSDAARAMRLAETLQQLEEGNGSEDSHSRTSGDEGTNARSNISQGQ